MAQGMHATTRRRAEEGSRCMEKIASLEKIDFVATYLISCLSVISFGFAIWFLKE